ncbi:PorV/PorQ family protein [Marinilabilia rubra]|uniref:PorV/PorQ family protein n=1 Tax=Marinilabilia rubra TaxID=2162893 RepID=A0A2U2BD46_9BACT|nr:hypothetical protein [Marinilabilia rubra]PWE00988.1 hypothetical protein DDZ16_00420 [Marinilabilia rubra]
MKTRLLFTWLSVLLFSVTEAQNYDYPSPVTTAMGLSGASDTTEWSLFSNPAGLSSVSRMSGGIGYHNAFGISALSARSAFFVVPTHMLTPALSYIQYGDDLYEIQTFSCSAARSISPMLRMGIRFEYLLRHIYGTKAESAFVIDAGVNYNASENVTIALFAQNPGRTAILDDYNEYVLPSSLAVACTFRLSSSFFLTADLNHREDLARQFYSFGLSAMVHQKASVRGGISARPVRLAVGSTLSWKRVEINFSANYHDRLGLSTTAGIAYALDFKGGGEN